VTAEAVAANKKLCNDLNLVITNYYICVYLYIHIMCEYLYTHKVIAEAVAANKELCDDLDLVIMTHSAFGKGFMKKARVSPDAFFQVSFVGLFYRSLL